MPLKFAKLNLLYARYTPNTILGEVLIPLSGKQQQRRKHSIQGEEH